MLQSIFQSVVGIVIGVIQIAMFMWFCHAIGSAFESEKSPYYTGIRGGDIGALIGLILGVGFSIYWLFII
jgi:hypothetical protein